MKGFKTLGWLLLIGGFTFAAVRLGMRIYASYTYKVTIASNWVLAERASTLAQKSEYVDKFIEAIDQPDLYGSNANLLFETPATDYNENLKAVKSLQSRLDTIATMDENSFAYQTALHQITEQEQGQADTMLETLHECWMRVRWPSLWHPIIGFVYGLTQVLLMYVGIAVIRRDVLWGISFLAS